MSQSITRRVSAVAILAGVGLVACGKLPGMPNVPGMPDVPGTCKLDVSSVASIEGADFAAEFGIDAKAGGKLKAATAAALELQGFAAKIDADLKVGCAGLAKDLGAEGEYKNAEEACKAALKVMGEVKGKLGASAKIDLKFEPPKCGVSIDAAASCAAECDVSVKGPEAKFECEPGKLSGECGAKCEGSCELTAAAKCEGSCSGSCDAKFDGTCGGKCDGKCDGKATGTKGGAECNGKCEGKCDAKASGSCGGQCTGGCELKGSAECKGTCSGKCSVEMKAPKCNGEITPPKMDAECKGKCDAKLSAKAECSEPRIALVIAGAADAGAAAKLKGALEKNLPAILKIAVGIGAQAPKVAASVQTTLEGVQGSFEGIAKASGGGGGGAAKVGLKLTSCLLAPFKGAFDAAASIKANVNVSVDVKASASASGSASGKAG